MNLVEQIFAQARAGSAEGAGLGQFFAAGVQQGQRQQQLDMQKQQLAMEIAQAPLKQTLLQQQSQMDALKIEQGLKARQDDLEATGAFTGLASAVTDKLKVGNLDEAILEFTKGGLNNNVLLADPRYQSLGKQLDLMQREADLAEYRKGVVDARLEATRNRLDTSAEAAQLKVRDQELRQRELDIREKNIDRLAKRLNLSASDNAELKSLYKQIDLKRTKLEDTSALPEMTGMFWNRQPNPKRAALQAEIDALTARAKQIGKGETPDSEPAVATPAAPAGRVRVKSPDGKLGTIPASQLDEALRNGFIQQ